MERAPDRDRGTAQYRLAIFESIGVRKIRGGQTERFQLETRLWHSRKFSKMNRYEVQR